MLVPLPAPMPAPLPEINGNMALLFKHKLPARLILAAVISAAIPALADEAHASTICTIVADAASGEIVKEEGRCDERAVAASTFKIPISLMGFDAGILKDAQSPALPFKEGYADWRPSWRHTTDPAKWMKDSVVWYSQEMTRKLGEPRFQNYVQTFQYGDMDLSGEAGKNNGLTYAWLRSLKISPREQVAFLRKVAMRQLPVSDTAYDMTGVLIDQGLQPGGWHVYGKTGAGLATQARKANAADRYRGWFVGWATKNGRTLVFARLTAEEKVSVASSAARRDAVVHDLFSEASGL